MRGNAIGHRQKLKQAKVFTVLSYLVGAGLIIGLIMWVRPHGITVLLNITTLAVSALYYIVLCFNILFKKKLQHF